MRGFRRRRPDVTATVLRFAPFIGPTADTTLTRLLRPAGRADRASAATPGCSSCTSTTRWRCCTGRSSRTTRAPTTWPGRACSRCPRRSAGPAGSPCRCSSRACPAPPRSPAACGFGRLRPRPARPLRARPGGRHHPAGAGVRLHAPLHRRRVRRLHPRPPGRVVVTRGSWPLPSGSSWTASGRSAPRAGAVRERERVSRARARQSRPGRAVTAAVAGPADGQPARRTGTATRAGRADPDRPAATRRRRPSRLTHRPAPSRRCRTARDLWDRRVATGLAFLRRRLTGDYEVDEFGFDPELTDAVFHPLLRLLYRDWFRIEVSGVEHVPADGPAWSSANHSGTVALDALMLSAALHDEHPAAPLPAAARRRPGLPDAGAVRAGPQDRRHASPATRTPSGCSATASWSASSPRGSRASASPTPTGTSCSASAGAGSSRRRCAPAPRSCRWRSSAPRRSTRCSPTSSRSPGCSGCRTSRSRRRSRGSARWAWCRCRASGSSSSARRSRPRTCADSADDPMVVFNLADQVRETIQQTLHTLLERRPDPFG